MKCECCREEQHIYNYANFLLCKKCKEVAVSDFSKVKELIKKRQEKRIDKAISKLM